MSRLLSATLAAAFSLSAPAQAGGTSGPATPTYKYLPKLDENHGLLVSAITNQGVKFIVNPPRCWENENEFGWFWMFGKELVICQEEKTYPGSVVSFSPEDLDTIRHEAQHMIQECMDGKWNSKLHPVYRDPIALGTHILGYKGVERVHEVYSNLPYDFQVLEVEAFAVAAMNDPIDQAKDLLRHCENTYRM